MQKANKNLLDSKNENDVCKSFRINAAGSNSQTFKELKGKITHFTGMSYDGENADMLLRFRKSQSSNIDAWEVFIRLSKRPLSQRSWRTRNFKGALNPILANILYDLSMPKKGDKLINIMCGAGTILIEAQKRKKLERLVGIDNDSEVLNMCKEHIKNAKAEDIEIFNMDARNLSFKDNEFTLALSDFPWGENIGNIKDNYKLYLDTLKEVSRVVINKGHIGIITQDSKNLLLVIKSLNLKILSKRKVYQGGFFPYIYILENVK